MVASCLNRRRPEDGLCLYTGKGGCDARSDGGADSAGHNGNKTLEHFDCCMYVYGSLMKQ